MSDRYHDEVRKLWRLRDEIRGMTPAELVKLAVSLGDNHAKDWIFTARDNQLPPLDFFDTWVINAGRGFGKTRAGAEAVHLAVEAGYRRLHLVGPTAADVRDVIVEGESGILATAKPGVEIEWVPSKRRLEWPNGAIAITFSGEEPESLRGPQCEFCWIDEIARMRYQEMVYDMATFGLRLGDQPRMLITTTPRPTQFYKKLLKRSSVVRTGGSIYENEEHLAQSFLDKVRETYEGTSLGQQELHGLLMELESDLFRMEWIRRDLPPMLEMSEVAVGVDPSGGADEIGIVVAGRHQSGNSVVLADRTVKGSPESWGRAAVKAYDDFSADNLVVEVNYGGDMATSVIQQAALNMYSKSERDSPSIRIKQVTASRGKVLRAEPVSLLYEQGKVIHAANLQKLEAEMSSFTKDWDRKVDGSPNRLDAMVWALTKTSVRSGKIMSVA